MVDLNAHEAGNGGQSQGKPTTRGVLLYSEREGPPLNVTWLEFRPVEGLHPPGIFNSNEKRILPFAAIRKRHHSGDWPVYGHFTALIGNCVCPQPSDSTNAVLPRDSAGK